MKKKSSTPLIKESNLTLSQMNNILHVAGGLLDNLDEQSILQIYEGYNRDVDHLLNNLLYETSVVLYTKDQSVDLSSFQHIEKLTESIEDTFRKNSLIYFIQSVLPDFELNWHHLEWASHIESYRYSCTICSRGMGKSYYYSKALPLWKMYRYERPKMFERQSRDIALCEAGMIFTYEMGLGEDLLSFIKDEIETNDILGQILLPDTGDGWAARSIKCKNGAKLEVKSYGSKARGRHPGYIIVDDFLTDNVLYSDDQNKKIIDYFNSVIVNMPQKGGPIYVVGTPFLQNDLYGEFKKGKRFKVFEYPAVFPDGSLLWPWKKSWKELMIDKESQSSISFSREILCRPITNDSTIFPYEMISRCFNPKTTLIRNIQSSPIKFKKIVSGHDFAMSSSIGADSSVDVVLGVDDLDRMWILYLERLTGKSFGEQMAHLKSIHAAFRPDVMVFEDNNFQRIFYEEAGKSGLPVVGHTTTTNKYDLKEGLPSLALLFEHLNIQIPRGDQYSIDKTDILVSELGSITFTPKGLKATIGHDDTGLALWKAVCGVRYKTSFGFDFM